MFDFGQTLGDNCLLLHWWNNEFIFLAFEIHCWFFFSCYFRVLMTNLEVNLTRLRKLKRRKKKLMQAIYHLSLKATKSSTMLTVNQRLKRKVSFKAIFHLSKKVARKKSRIESYLFDFEKSSRSILVIAQ